MPVVFPSGLPPTHRTGRVVAVIPARFRSVRLPGKPLAEIDGRPMIEHVYRRAADARTVDAVLVATDDERIADVVDRFGGLAVLTRNDHPSGTDRIAEVAACLESDIVVNVQGDLPFLAPEPINAVVRLVRDTPGIPMATLRQRVTDPAELASSSVVKVVIGLDGRALYFSRRPIPFVREGHPPAPVWKHLGLYVYRREFLLSFAALAPTALERAEGLEQLRALEHGYVIGTVETNIETLEIDTPEDLERARKLVEPSVPS